MTLIAGTDTFRIANRIVTLTEPEPQDEAVAQSYLGTPVYDQLIFPAEGNEEIQLINDLVINDVIFRVTRLKIIVKTPVQGRKGTVKELVTLGDYQIEIMGKIVSEYPNQKPIDKLRELLKVESYEGNVSVAVKFLSAFDIETILIERIECTEERGFYNEIPFTIMAVSDDPIELQLRP